MSRRVPLGWEVCASAYDDLQQLAAEEYGDVPGSTGKAAREAILEFINADRYSRVEQRLDEILGLEADTSASPGGKKTLSVDPDETTVAGVRVGEDVKDLAREKADEWGVTLGDLATAAFREYAHGGRPDRLLDKLDRAEGVLEDSSDDRTTTEKIADRVTDPEAEQDAFNTDDVIEAADAEGVTTPDYVLEKYLPRVLDETGYVPVDGYDDGVTRYFRPDMPPAPDHPDPGALPYKAMDDDDLRLALQVEVARRADRGASKKLTVPEAQAHINGNPRSPTVEEAMEVAGSELGFGYQKQHRGPSDDPRLVVRPSEFDPDHNEEILQIAGIDIEDDASDHGPGADADVDTTTIATDGGEEYTDEDLADGWVERAADLLDDVPEDALGADPVVNNRIVRAQYPDRYGDVEYLPEDAPTDAVTDDERQRVRRALNNDSGPATDDDETPLEDLSNEELMQRADAGRGGDTTTADEAGPRDLGGVPADD